VFVARCPRFDQEQLREAIARSRSWAEALRFLQYRSGGGNWMTLKKYAKLWDISTAHFDPDAVRAEALRGANIPRPIEEILVADSTYSRTHLKIRLFAEGMKDTRCELCGQGETWRGRRMALILDHINGFPTTIAWKISGSCARTVQRRSTLIAPERTVSPLCPERASVVALSSRHATASSDNCSRTCGARYRRTKLRGIPRPATRRVARPPYEQLIREIEETRYLAVGRKYGVSDNAVRKWVRFYERQAERRGIEGELANGSQLALPDA
jgi:hypothetical protein